MPAHPHILTTASIQQYIDTLENKERSASTIAQYTHALQLLLCCAANRPLEKSLLIAWKKQLMQHYTPTTVNAFLAAVNGYFKYYQCSDLLIQPLKIQRLLFSDEHKELSHAEYRRLVQIAEHTRQHRLALILQTIAATGIRVSELRFITADAVRSGRAYVHNKGKHRLVLLPTKLCVLLKRYLRQQKKSAGPVFTTRTGRPIDRSNIWRAMKNLCGQARVAPEKVFPHNLRHLFARTFYAAEKDLLRLADLLGHASINTTRIYTLESGAEHLRQLDRMHMVIT